MTDAVFPLVAAHSVSLLLAHVVWSTRDRQPTFLAALDRPLGQMLAVKARELRAAVHAFGAALDHVHVLLQHPPDVGIAAIVQRLKGSSSHALGRRLPGGWQAGYWVQSVSPDVMENVAAYVRAQRSHHASAAAHEPWQDGARPRRA
jgi:putative transposase